MPILWKYLLKGYFQLFILCVSAFVSVLLVVRFQEIALFASSGANLYQIALFSLYQIPYILPLAIPISSLITCMILLQRMSSCLEITALRSCGFSLASLSYPLFLTGCILSLVNFTIASEMAPLTRTLAKHLLHTITSNNPFIVMQRDSPVTLKSFDFDLKNLEPGKKAEEILCIMRQDSQERIGLFFAKELSIDAQSIHGKSLSLLSSVDPQFSGYDHLIIENQESMQMSKNTITAHLFSTDWFAKDNLLPLKEALHKHRTEKGNLITKTGLDLVRRVFFGLCPLSFTFIGIAFGLHIGRSKRKGAIFTAFFLAFLILGSFLTAKTLAKTPILALALFVIPQPLAILISMRSLLRISRGTCSC